MAKFSFLPGFRFHPRDEELVGYYLRRKVAGELTEAERSVIPDADLLRSEPWDLVPQTSENNADCFAFWRRGRKYTQGCRANRCTANGYWKSTGSDRAVIAEGQRIGMKKTLVFYVGKAPRGNKTDWVMHEFRLLDDDNNGKAKFSTGNSLVVCRVFQRRTQADGEKEECQSPEPAASPSTLTSQEFEEQLLDCTSVVTHQSQIGSSSVQDLPLLPLLELDFGLRNQIKGSQGLDSLGALDLLTPVKQEGQWCIDEIRTILSTS